MSLKRNILANYASQIYVTVIAIVMVPLYIEYMGAEVFGLVGFFAMLQAWFQLLDMGLTPTMARETARFGGGAVDALSLRRLLRALEGVFITVALVGATVMMFSADFIARSWLKAQHLPVIEVRNAIVLMAVIVALRWMCGLYRSAINGFERLLWLNAFNIGVATLRFCLVIPVLIYVGATAFNFFVYQLIVALIELAFLVIKVYRLMPTVDRTVQIDWSWQPLRKVLKFSATIAFTGAVWVFATQADKLILSGVISLADYAYFTLGVLVASGTLVISGPISGAILPRMTKLHATGDEAGLIQLYRRACQLVALVAIPAAMVLVVFAEQVLWAWTGSSDIAAKAAPVLSLYALGNGMLALAAFPYYLQVAKGDLNLHLIGNCIFAAIFIPVLFWSASVYGAIGAGYAWILANTVILVFWLPVVHKRMSNGLHSVWLLQDVGPIAIASLVVVAVAYNVVIWSAGRVSVAITIALIGLVLVFAAGLSSAWLRQIFREKLRATYQFWGGR